MNNCDMEKKATVKTESKQEEIKTSDEERDGATVKSSG